MWCFNFASSLVTIIIAQLFVNTGLPDIFSINPECLRDTNNRDLIVVEVKPLADNRDLQCRQSNEQFRIESRTYSYTLFPLPAVYLS